MKVYFSLQLHVRHVSTETVLKVIVTPGPGLAVQPLLGTRPAGVAEGNERWRTQVTPLTTPTQANQVTWPFFRGTGSGHILTGGGHTEGRQDV